MTPYITYADVLAKMVGIDLSDLTGFNDQITNEFIPAAQSQIDTLIGHAITATPMTKYYHGTGREQIVLGKRPISDISQVVIYSLPYTSRWLEFSHICRINNYDTFGNLITAEVVPTQQTDLIVDCAKGILQVPLTALTYAVIGTPINYPQWLPGSYNVKVSFTFGYPVENMPRQVKDACAYQAAILAIMAKGSKLSKGLQSVRIGDMQQTFSPGGGTKTAAPFAGLLAKYDSEVKRLVMPFKTFGV